MAHAMQSEKNFHFACSIRKMNRFRNKFSEVKISAKQSAGKDKFNRRRPYFLPFLFSKSISAISNESVVLLCFFSFFFLPLLLWFGAKLLSHPENSLEFSEKLLFHIHSQRGYWLLLNFTCKYHVSVHVHSVYCSRTNCLYLIKCISFLLHPRFLSRHQIDIQTGISLTFNVCTTERCSALSLPFSLSLSLSARSLSSHRYSWCESASMVVCLALCKAIRLPFSQRVQWSKYIYMNYAKPKIFQIKSLGFADRLIEKQCTYKFLAVWFASSLFLAGKSMCASAIYCWRWLMLLLLLPLRLLVCLWALYEFHSTQ